MGALLVADNLIVNRDGTADSRRGVAAAGSALSLASGQYIAQWFAYQNRLLINDSTGALNYDSTGALAWVQSTGSFLPASGASKVRGIEANKNFYLATSTGVWKLSSYSSTPVLSGVPPGLDGTAALASAGSGFLGHNFQCAYQIVFGYTDVNGNLNLGAPSERILAINDQSGSDNVILTFSVPQGLTTSYFYQVYRTPQTVYSLTPSANVPPGAEPQLSAQYPLTSGEISAGVVTFTDVTTDALLGAFLYTNPSQQGALQPNLPPPLCVDFCVFNQMVFYANCQTLQTATFNMISVGSPNGVQVGDTITINGVVFTGDSSQNNATQKFLVTTGGTVASNIDATARALIACVNANASTTKVYAIYLSGFNSLPGLIELQAINFSQGVFYVTSSRGGAFSPALPVSGTTFGSSNDSTPNGIYVSKAGQPEAVPSVNLLFVGGGDQPILRVLPLQDRVVVIKTDGIFVITGTQPSALTITLLDNTVICIASESARLLNNSVYMMSQQGVVAITASGVTIQSRAIEGSLLSLTGPSFPSFSTICHAISYESERLYILALPTSGSDTYATQEYCYNWVTNAWTRWTLDIASGIVNPYDNKLYIGRPTNRDYAYQERKTYGVGDYMDDTYAVVITGIDSTGLVISLSTTPLQAWVGWALAQTPAGTATITSVDTVANTVTVDLTMSVSPGTVITWKAGAASIQVPISISYLMAPITAGFPHFMKNWGRCDFWFNDSFSSFFKAGFVTDTAGPSALSIIISNPIGGYGSGNYGQGAYGTTATTPQPVQTLVLNGNGARWVSPFLSSSFPGVKFGCLGTTIGYEIISDVSG